MMPISPPRPIPATLAVLSLLSLTSSLALAQGPRPPLNLVTKPPASAPDATKPAASAPAPPTIPDATPGIPVPPPSPVRDMRSKISAGDLLSAESMLEVHRAKNGEDSAYLAGLSWLARGALLLGENQKADRYVADVRARCADRLAHGDSLKNYDVETPLGAAMEVAAQRIAQTKGKRAAADFVRGELARIPGPMTLRSRLNKRINMLTMTGTPAPELEIDDFLGEKPTSLAALRGKPVVVFLWAEWCGDCRAQAAALARVKSHYEKQGVHVVAVTRYFAKDDDRAREKARVDSVWAADYKEVGKTPIVFSAASMERYGVSSTPTFVFVDREGIVRRYTPTRLTEAEFDRTLATLLR